MKRLLVALLPGLLVPALSGCMAARLSADGVGVPVSMTEDLNRPYVVVRHFRVDLKSSFLFFDLVTLRGPDVAGALRRQLASTAGEGVANLTIQGHTTLLDGLVFSTVGILGALAIGRVGVSASHLLNMRTYTLEGEVVRYTSDGRPGSEGTDAP